MDINIIYMYVISSLMLFILWKADIYSLIIKCVKTKQMIKE